MSRLQDIRTPLMASEFFHVYNRGNGGQLIFYEERNYYYFLEKYRKYMQDYWDTYSYCLLPNHFHLLVKVKPTEELIEAALRHFNSVSAEFLKNFVPTDKTKNAPDLLNFKNLVGLNKKNYAQVFLKGNPAVFHEKLLQWVVSERFRRLMLGYAKAINRQEDRSGSLFQKLFRRKHITDTAYLANAVLYIHRNPVHHGIAPDLADWFWTSYEGMISDKETSLKRYQVLEWFDGLENFKNAQANHVQEWKNGVHYIVDD